MGVLRALVVIAVCTHVAAASPAAEQLFQEGRKLLGQNKLPEACDAFRRSAELEPRVGTWLNLADCEEKRGRIATAWEAFSEARAVARRTSDRRAAEADRRAKKLEAKLPYLAIKLSPGAKAQGVIVQRGGIEVPAAALDQEVAIDPGHYEITATAKDRLPFTTEIDIPPAMHREVIVPELEPDPAATPAQPQTIDTGPAPGGVVTSGTTASPPPGGTTSGSAAGTAGVVVAVPPPAAPGRHFGLGAAVGFSTDGDPLVGLRVPIRLGPLGGGAIRALPSVLFTHIQDPEDNTHDQELFALGMAIEYVAPVSRRFTLAMGLGFGMDIFDDSYETELMTQAWGAARLSPTLQLPAVDLGLHMQLVATKDNVVGLVELGVDYFFW